MANRYIIFLLIIHSTYAWTVKGQSTPQVSLNNIQFITSENIKDFIWDKLDKKRTLAEKDEIVNSSIKMANRLNEFQHAIAVDIEHLEKAKLEIDKEFKESMPIIHNYILEKIKQEQYLFLKIYEFNGKYFPIVRVHNTNLSLSENIAAEKSIEESMHFIRTKKDSDMDIGLEILNYISVYIGMFFSEAEDVDILDAPVDLRPVSERYKN